MEKNKSTFLTVALLSIILLLLFLWYRTNIMQFGPIVSNLKIESLDRNENSKPDTLKLTYDIDSLEKRIGFGGTTICIGDEFRTYSCKNVNINYPDESSDDSGHDLLCKGKTPFTRYTYFDSIPKFQGGMTIVTLKIIGSDELILQRKIIYSQKIDFSKFESLQLGEMIAGSTQYSRLDYPVENKTVTLSGSCKCVFDSCENMKDIVLKKNEPIR